MTRRKNDGPSENGNCGSWIRICTWEGTGCADWWIGLHMRGLKYPEDEQHLVI